MADCYHCCCSSLLHSPCCQKALSCQKDTHAFGGHSAHAKYKFFIQAILVLLGNRDTFFCAEIWMHVVTLMPFARYSNLVGLQAYINIRGDVCISFYLKFMLISVWSVTFVLVPDIYFFPRSKSLI